MTSTEDRVESARQLYGRWLNELWAGQPVAYELVSEDFVGHWPDHEVHGPDELASIIDKTRTMFTDLRFVIEVEPIVEGDRLAARWIGTGAAPDGPKRFVGNDILKFADGRVVEYWTGTSEG
jgi:predicted ester cyclase